MPEGRMKERWRTTVIGALVIIAALLIAYGTADLWHHGGG
jgi:hypothetical protein